MRELVYLVMKRGICFAEVVGIFTDPTDARQNIVAIIGAPPVCTSADSDGYHTFTVEEWNLGENEGREIVECIAPAHNRCYGAKRGSPVSWTWKFPEPSTTGAPRDG